MTEPAPAHPAGRCNSIQCARCYDLTPHTPGGYWETTDAALKASNSADRDTAREMNAESFGAPPFGTEPAIPPAPRRPCFCRLDPLPGELHSMRACAGPTTRIALAIAARGAA